VNTHLVPLAACLALVALASCTGATTAPTPVAPSSRVTCEATLAPTDAFSREGLEGTFVLRDEATGCTQATDAAMADEGFCPQSTFKIANALVGLETGVIEGEHHRWTWDGTPRRLKDWEQDLDLAGALRVSCVPCFQDVARRIGADRMRRYLHDFRYGNEDVSGPIDSFWLDGGSLRITPRAQTEFLHRMLSGELPVKRTNVDLVWRLLEIEHGFDFTYRGKTGLGSFEGRAIGWLVGYVERSGHRFIYATLVRSLKGADPEKEATRIMPLRKSISRALLVRAHVLPPR
jgi:beta-lactamase class D